VEHEVGKGCAREMNTRVRETNKQVREMRTGSDASQHMDTHQAGGLQGLPSQIGHKIEAQLAQDCLESVRRLS
jgi:hypothetical protein